jgi:hypothetical protein
MWSPTMDPIPSIQDPSQTISRAYLEVWVISTRMTELGVNGRGCGQFQEGGNRPLMILSQSSFVFSRFWSKISLSEFASTVAFSDHALCFIHLSAFHWSSWVSDWRNFSRSASTNTITSRNQKEIIPSNKRIFQVIGWGGRIWYQRDDIQNNKQ